jgi:hypothetical protein
MQQSMTSWIGRMAATACVVVIGACADAPTAPTATGSANPMVACDVNDGCGGSGYVGSSSANVFLRGFEDKSGGPTSEYYELRNRFLVGDQEVYYNPIFIHGDAFATGDFPYGIDLGRPFPCFGKLAVNILLNEVIFGHVVSSSPMATVEVTSADNGRVIGFWNAKYQSFGYVRYTWTGCQ